MTSMTNELCNRSSDTTMVYWPDYMIEFIKRTKEDLRVSQLICCAYLVELIFDLCIPKGDNVSDSPGFEKYIVKYTKKKIHHK